MDNLTKLNNDQLNARVKELRAKYDAIFDEISERERMLDDIRLEVDHIKSLIKSRNAENRQKAIEKTKAYKWFGKPYAQFTDEEKTKYYEKLREERDAEQNNKPWRHFI